MTTTTRRHFLTGVSLATGGLLLDPFARSVWADQRTINVNLADLDLPDGWSRKEHRTRNDSVWIVSAEHPAPVISMPLPVENSGHFELHLGMVVRPKSRNAAMQVKIPGQRVWRRVRPMRFVEDSVLAVQDGMLGVFELDEGSTLQIRTEPVSYAAIAYVTLTPKAKPKTISNRTRESSERAGEESEVSRLRLQPASAGVVFDTNMVMSTYRIEEPSDLDIVIAPYADSTFTHIFWGTGVGSYSPLYSSEALGWHGQEQKEFRADHRARTADAMRMLARHKVDPLTYATKIAHENGLQIWANDRISKNHEHDFRDDYPGGRFLLKHKDKRVLQSDFKPHYQCTMSFAYPEIRGMKVRTLVEQAKYDVDGLYLDFVRKPPLVGWESAVLDSFKKKYKVDPKKAPRDEWFDPWIDHGCRFVTEFMRDLREALDRVERERGRRIPVMAQVNGDWRYSNGFPYCRMDGLDPVVWAKEGLIDYLAPSETNSLWHQGQSFDRWRQLLAGTDCKLWGAMAQKFREGQRSTEERERLGPEHADLDPWRVLRHASDLYNQGAEGVYIWEAHDVPTVPQRWDVLKRIGDRQFLHDTFSSLIGPYDGAHTFRQKVLK